MVFEENAKDQIKENMTVTARITAGGVLNVWKARLDARPGPASTRCHSKDQAMTVQFTVDLDLHSKLIGLSRLTELQYTADKLITF